MIPGTPILEWLEIKINGLGREKVWGENSDWEKLDLDPTTESELTAYEELMNSVQTGIVCDECLSNDDKLWDKYYEDEDGIDFTNN